MHPAVLPTVRVVLGAHMRVEKKELLINKQREFNYLNIELVESTPGRLLAALDTRTSACHPLVREVRGNDGGEILTQQQNVYHFYLPPSFSDAIVTN